MKNKKISLYYIYLLSILYMECLFKILASNNIFTSNWIYTLFFDSFLAFALTILTTLGKRKNNRRVLVVFLLIFTIWFGAEIIFKNSFHVYFSLATTFFADQAVSFAGKIIEILFSSFFVIFLLLIPILVILFEIKIIDTERKNKKQKIMYISLAIISYLFFYGFLLETKEEYHSPYNLYIEKNNNSLNKETFGVIPSVFIEISHMIFQKDEKIYEVDFEKEKEDMPVVYEKNILEIPFEEKIKEEKDETIIKMHEVIKNDLGTDKNEYTGLFKDKNLILIMAESFNSIAVDKNLTPTLYKLTHEGFIFENFYSPVILSTIGGEFQELTGLYPNLSMLSNVWREGTNYFPFGYGNIFKKENYETFAYHNHKYLFQNRDKYLNSLGLSNYIGCGNGLETKINCKNWPESDVEMMSSTILDFVDKEKFMTYYITVSGHMSYNFKTNAMAIKNQNKVSHLPYSEDIKAYLATQIELDKALETLIKKLEEKGKLDDTVIALVADHYPYDISLEHINEIASPKKDEKIEINRSHFILWNNNIPSKKITKVGGNMDVLPTILNLFGMPFDSRLIMGRDLLSDSQGLVIFDDSSWMSDKGTYYANKKEFIPKKEGDMDWNSYVNKMNQIVSNRINLSKLILDKNYYEKVLGE